MNVQVIVPVVQVEKALCMFDSMSENTVLPNKVVVVNNSGKDFLVNDYLCTKTMVDTYIQKEPLEVNPSWKFGFEKTKNADIVCVLNDDLVLNKFFFKKLIDGFSKKNTVVLCPYTIIPKGVERHPKHMVGTPKTLKKMVVKNNRLYFMKSREGWAYSIRRSFLNTIPPIPDCCGTFCGDDWIWFWTLKAGYKWFLMWDNWVFHHVGSSVKSMSSKRELIREEKRKLLKVLNNEYGYHGYYPSKMRGVFYDPNS